MTEPAHTQGLRDPDGERQRRRAAALVERGLTEADAARFAADWPDQPVTETYTCHVCRRYLYDEDSGIVIPHRLLRVATITDDGVYTVCTDCDPLPLTIWQRLGRWILEFGVKPEINPEPRDE